MIMFFLQHPYSFELWALFSWREQWVHEETQKKAETYIRTRFFLSQKPCDLCDTCILFSCQRWLLGIYLIFLKFLSHIDHYFYLLYVVWWNRMGKIIRELWVWILTFTTLQYFVFFDPEHISYNSPHQFE